MKNGGYRNWADLPPELTSSILVRLGAVEILEKAQVVCKSWHRVCKDPWMWRKIVMHNDLATISHHENLCRLAVDRSQGGLVEIDIWHFCTDHVLNYIAERSSNLRILKLAYCHGITTEGFDGAIVKLPLLEELDISYCSFLEESLKLLGKSCPNLKMLKLLSPEIGYYQDDKFAIAIAESMPQLRHLQLFWNDTTSMIYASV